MGDKGMLLKRLSSAAVAIPDVDGKDVGGGGADHGAARPSEINIRRMNSSPHSMDRSKSFFRRLSSMPGMNE